MKRAAVGSTPGVPEVDTSSEAPISLEFFTPSALSFSAARRRHFGPLSTAAQRIRPDVGQIDPLDHA